MNVGTDAAPAGRRRTLLLHSGGAGVPPGGTTTPREELADGGPRGLPEALRARPPKRGRRFPSRRRGETERQKARPGAVTTLRWRAERRHTFARRCDLRPNDAPLGAPSPRFLRGKERRYGVSGAAKNTGDDACLGANRASPARGARWLIQCSRNSPLIAFSSAGLISLKGAASTECSGPSSFSCQNARKRCSSGNSGNRS